MRIVYSIIILLFISGCSTEKNNFKNRTYHSMTAWFNTLFNGQEAMDQKLDEMKSGYIDDYFSVLTVEPLPKITDDPFSEAISYEVPKGIGIFSRVVNSKGTENKEEKVVRTGFEKAELKALKAIENHSMLIRGEEKNRLMSRAYLMLGQARYYQGKSYQAIEALKEVQRLPFDKNKFKAKFFEALALQQTGNHSEATAILADLKNKDLNKKLKSLIYKNLAQSQFNNEKYADAIQSLNIAIDATKNRDTKARLTYILGQYYTKNNQFQKANAAYDKVYKLKPGFEMEARSQLAKALNFQPGVNNYLGFRDQLLKLTKIGTYKTYHNEFYYGLGKLELKIDSINRAKFYFEKALKEEKSDSRYRGETFTELANIYFNKADYIYASAYYDSAVAIYPNSPRKDELTLTQSSLNSIKEMYYTIQKNDSILRISKMNVPQLEEFFKAFIKKLKVQDEKRISEEKRFNNKSSRIVATNNFKYDTKKSGKFYFYNVAVRTNGEQAFIREWGNRSLQDNWRYSNLETKSIEAEKAKLTGAADLTNPRRYEPAYYKEQIPDNETLNQLKLERDSLSLALGIAYYDSFNNKDLSTKTLENLMVSPPQQEEIKTEALFQLYRINKGNSTGEKYKNRILNEHPNSIFAQYILNPKKDLNSSNSEDALGAYNQIYMSYKNQDYQKVHQLYNLAKESYNNEPIFSKIELMQAFSLAKTSGAEAYIEALKQVATKYRDTPEAKRAKELIDNFNKRFKKPKPDAIEPNK